MNFINQRIGLEELGECNRLTHIINLRIACFQSGRESAAPDSVATRGGVAGLCGVVILAWVWIASLVFMATFVQRTERDAIHSSLRSHSAVFAKDQADNNDIDGEQVGMK